MEKQIVAINTDEASRPFSKHIHEAGIKQIFTTEDAIWNFFICPVAEITCEQGVFNVQIRESINIRIEKIFVYSGTVPNQIFNMYSISCIIGMISTVIRAKQILDSEKKRDFTLSILFSEYEFTI